MHTIAYVGFHKPPDAIVSHAAVYIALQSGGER